MVGAWALGPFVEHVQGSEACEGTWRIWIVVCLLGALGRFFDFQQLTSLTLTSTSHSDAL